MAGWRTLAICLSLLVLAPVAHGQTYLLQEKNQKDAYLHVDLDLQLKGKLLIANGKVESMEQQATAHHDYVERVLDVGDHGLFGRAVRFYQSAKSSITVDKNKVDHTLPDNRTLIVTQHGKEGVLSYCLKSPLTRDELDLLEHFDTLSLPGLLPGKEVSVGDTWKLHDAAAQGLCYFDGLTTNNLTGKLKEVKDKKAVFTIAGDARGICTGADVKLKVSAEGTFDLATDRITALTWTQDEEREQGPASPKITAQVTVKLAREEVQAVKELSNVALAGLPDGPTPPTALLQLPYSDPKGRYQLSHDRGWMLVARTDEHLVLRLLDRGDFVAQVSISCWPKAKDGKQTDPKDFQAAMDNMPGWAVATVTDGPTVDKAPNGNSICRLAEQGKLNGIDTVQYFYLVAGPDGQQAVLAFAMTPAQVKVLGRRDVDLVNSLTFPAVAPKTSGKPGSPTTP